MVSGKCMTPWDKKRPPEISQLLLHCALQQAELDLSRAPGVKNSTGIPRPVVSNMWRRWLLSETLVCTEPTAICAPQAAGQQDSAAVLALGINAHSPSLEELSCCQQLRLCKAIRRSLESITSCHQ